MCIIIINAEKKQVSNEMLLKSSVLNPDGLGITWLDTFETEYSLSSDWEILCVARPYIAHFRLATVGAISLENNHPFQIGDTGKMLYQNGTVYNLGDEGMTDTEHMAMILAGTESVYWPDVLEMTDCRWVIVHPDTKEYELFNEDMFVEHGKQLYSKPNVIDQQLVAVYGTLKKGFGNHHVMGTSKFVSKGMTYNAYPMVAHGIPFVYSEKGVGSCVKVELYLVDKLGIGPIDRLEGHPHNYCRKKTPILLEDGVTIVNAYLYFYQGERNKGDELLSEFTRGYSITPTTPVYQTELYGSNAYWYDDAPSDISAPSCTKCGSTDTMWDDYSKEVYCYSCDSSVQLVKLDT